MRVDVCEVGGVGEVAVQEPGEEDVLEGWGEEGGRDVEAWVPSGFEVVMMSLVSR